MLAPVRVPPRGGRGGRRRRRRAAPEGRVRGRGGRPRRRARRTREAQAVPRAQPVDGARPRRFGAAARAAAGFHADIREAFAFGVLDGRRWDEYIATFDLQVSDLPRVLVLDRPAERFFDEYRPPETGDGEVAAASLRNYLRSIMRGEAKARYLNWRGSPDRLKRFWAKRKALVLAGVVVVVLLFVAIGRACAGDEKEKEE